MQLGQGEFWGFVVRKQTHNRKTHKTKRFQKREWRITHTRELQNHKNKTHEYKHITDMTTEYLLRIPDAFSYRWIRYENIYKVYEEIETNRIGGRKTTTKCKQSLYVLKMNDDNRLQILLLSLSLTTPSLLRPITRQQHTHTQTQIYIKYIYSIKTQLRN